MDDNGRIEFLLDLQARHGLERWALFPTYDEAAALLARHADRLAGHFLLTTPSWEAMRWCYDKRLTYNLASRLGIEQPATWRPRNREEVAALACDFPAILKPAFKNRRNPFTLARAWRVESRQHLLERYDQACAMVGPNAILVQELIPGGGEAQLSYAALCSGGRPVAWLTARRSRQYPPEFGRGSSFVETVEEPALHEPARRLLAAIDYSGLVELEFKLDPRNGRRRLLDINPRTWGWHTLGRRAGVDFPYLSWRLVQGETIAETQGRPGVRWVRGVTDLPAALTAIRQRRLSLRAYLLELRPPLECAVLAFDDPLPAIVDRPSLLYRAWRRRGGERRDPAVRTPAADCRSGGHEAALLPGGSQPGT